MPEFVNIQSVSSPNYSNDTVSASNLKEVKVQHDSLIEIAEKYNDQLDKIIDKSTFTTLPGWTSSICAPCDIINKELEPFNPPNELNLPSLAIAPYPEFIAPDPIILPIGDVEFTFVAPIPPSEISPTFNWIAGEFTSEIWEALFNKIHGDIINGGTGLTEAVYNAIIAREQEARRINQDREYSKALSASGAAGFNLPSGHIAAVQIEMGRENLSQDQQALDNLTIKDLDLATENTRFAITSGIELEKLLRATWDAIESRGLEAAKVAGEYIIAVYDANIKAYLAAWEGIKLELEAEKNRIEAITAANENAVKVFIGQADVYKTQVDAIKSKNEGIVDIRKGEIAVYTAELEAAVRKYEASLSDVKVKLEASRIDITETIEKNKFHGDIFMRAIDMDQRFDETFGQFYAQLAASAFGGINASMAAGSNVSAARSEALGNSAALTEGHTYKEK